MWSLLFIDRCPRVSGTTQTCQPCDCPPCLVTSDPNLKGIYRAIEDHGWRLTDFDLRLRRVSAARSARHVPDVVLSIAVISEDSPRRGGMCAGHWVMPTTTRFQPSGTPAQRLQNQNSDESHDLQPPIHRC